MVDKIVKNNSEYIIKLRRYFHENPEPSLREYKTADKIENELNALHIRNERVGETGIVGYIGFNNDGKTIGLRADIDALEIEEKNDVDYKSKSPGLMHACGHDGHTASLLGAAKILKAKEDELNGRVKLFFQQGEEIGQGAVKFIENNHLEDVDNVFSLHLSTGLDIGKVSATEGSIMAACDYFKITIHGKSGHVSAPHKAIDALYLASQLVVNLQGIVSRHTDPVDPIVLGIGVLHSGTRYNIVSNKAVLEGTIRVFSQETRAKTRKLIEDITRSTIEANGGKVDIEFEEFANPVINEKYSTELAQNVGREILGEKNIITNQEKRLGADDFAEFLLKVPGVYVNIGSKNPDNINTQYDHHHEHFDIDEEALLISTEYYVKYTLEYLNTKK